MNENNERAAIAAHEAQIHIGEVRYSSNQQLAIRLEQAKVFMELMDVYDKRFGFFGPTRSGKSEGAKSVVDQILNYAATHNLPLAVVIAGEAAEYHEDTVNGRSLRSLHDDRTIVFDMSGKPDRRPLKINFYEQRKEAFDIHHGFLGPNRQSMSQAVQTFLDVGVYEPDPSDRGDCNRARVVEAVIDCMHHKAGFVPPPNRGIQFSVSQQVREAVNEHANAVLPDPNHGMTLENGVEWFSHLRGAHYSGQLPPSSGSGMPWCNNHLEACLDMLEGKNNRGASIRGYRVLSEALPYHTPDRTSSVSDEIYDALSKGCGQLVIIDSSLGLPEVTESMISRIMRDVFNRSRSIVNRGDQPVHIIVLIEEAHTLLPKNQDLTNIWSRIAKEGAKFGIGMMYLTQEISSIQPNILANTENIFAFGMNNEMEARVLSHYFDFSDFQDSLLRSRDVGFARVKMHSRPFTIPVQLRPLNTGRSNEPQNINGGDF